MRRPSLRRSLPGDGVRWRIRIATLRRELRIEWHSTPPAASPVVAEGCGAPAAAAESTDVVGLH